MMLARWLAAMMAALLLMLAAPALAAVKGGGAVATDVVSACQIPTAADTGAAEMLARPAGPCTPPGRATRGVVWLDFGAPAQLGDGKGLHRLLIDTHRVHRVDLYLARADGSVSHERYDPAAPGRGWRTGGYLSMIVPAGAPVTRMLVRLGDTELITFSRPTRLVPLYADFRMERRDAALYGLALGVLALTIFAHLALFFAIRQRFQLFYVAHATVLFLYAAAYSGLVLLVVPGVSAGGISRLISATLSVATATGLLFSTDFIARRYVPRGLRFYSLISAAASVACAVLLLFGPDGLTAPVYGAANLVGMNGLVLVVVVLAVGAIRGSHTARILGLGWAVPIAIGVTYPLRILGLVPDALVGDGAMVAAVTVECLILSLPVVTRIKAMRLDHERVRERQLVLERQAATDALTGLANRRGFVAAIERALQIGGPSSPVALLMIDIDHFKAVNDRYGHVRADAVLAGLGALIARAAGPGAIVARYGGEEFVVLLMGLDLNRAHTIAERIRAGVCAGGADLLDVTVSIGLAGGRCDGVDRLMVDADLALYDAKRGGRNRVEVAAAAKAAMAA
ncbi:diguanylate cyclase [Sphingomonas flavalba]|uniref:sensor domain-containing diguanylate cyclase n=1 Tax=Sphingomonas flavalba TaxID=2559804 RepID=UPI0039DFE60A